MKQLTIKTLLALLIMILTAAPALGGEAAEIMRRVEREADESSNSFVQKIKLSTCKYGKRGRKNVCVETPRVKVIEIAGKDCGPGGKDGKAISVIQAPAREKNMGMLTFEYDDPDKDTISRLYLPAMKKVKKIVSGKSDDDSGESYFGSEILIEDLETMDAGDYSHKLLKKTQYAGRPVWIVESTPSPKKLRKTRYGRLKIWVDRQRHIILKIQTRDKRLKPYKRIIMKDIRKIDGVWTSMRTIVQNLASRRITTMTADSVRFNVAIPDQLMTERALTDVVYRERELKKLRKLLR